MEDKLLPRTGAVYGIDVSEDRALISYVNPDGSSPVTVSLVYGEENYCVPMAVAKKEGIGQWYTGEEAISHADEKGVTLIPDFYKRALENEKIIVDADLFSGRDIFTIYLRRLLSMALTMSGIKDTQLLVFCVQEVTQETVSLFSYCAEKIGIDRDKIAVIDKKEAFYYYCLSQSPDIRRHDLVLFECENLNVYALRLNKNASDDGEFITLDEKYFTLDPSDKDSSFDEALKEMLKGNLVSAIFLTGAGFSREWMNLSLQRALLGHRVFTGQNLYTRGAVYAAMVKTKSVNWGYTYVGDHELKLNVSLKVSDLNDLKFYPLIRAGESWYEEKGECEVILDGSPEVEIYIGRPDSRKTVASVLKLKDLPVRDNRLTRLRITATPLSDKKVSIKILDMGFGEIARGSGKTFTTTIGVD
ncbi:MAG: hypothetical protein DUD27_05295 [Lachnospiraceae bacterium]|uniref:DUF5716 domain-containing protein n=1 Tax=Candidatus Weimeria bifida TaxID=2599074 RepID=A0A6N7IYV9_9FIRM|nr:hypothetical protein [Candidatus Weimeria bifida]RRF96352.1 MAG: hypothetical protein DUD27_05295 [Lachnospiraceae bacterium]